MSATLNAIEPLSEAEIADVADNHAEFVPGEPDPYCGSCCEPWPCTTARLIAAVRPELVPTPPEDTP